MLHLWGGRSAPSVGPALLLTGLGCCPGYHELLLLPSLNPTANRITGKSQAGEEEEESTNL